MEYPIDDLINEMNFSDNTFKTLPNGLMLTNWELSVLDRYHIPYKKCNSLKEVLFEIEKTVDIDEELESVAVSISERDYYQNTNF